MPAALAFFWMSSVADEMPERSMPPHQTRSTIARPRPDPVFFIRASSFSEAPCPEPAAKLTSSCLPDSPSTTLFSSVLHLLALLAPPDVEPVPVGVELAEIARVLRDVVVLVTHPLRDEAEAGVDRNVAGDARAIDGEGVGTLVHESCVGTVYVQPGEHEPDAPLQGEAALAVAGDGGREVLGVPERDGAAA